MRIENTATAPRDHNNPPDPLDDALAPFAAAIEEAENWLDGQPVQDEAAMKAADALAKDMKAALKAVQSAEESETKPLYDEWKAAKARYKPTLDDLDRLKKGLAALVNDFKRRLAEERERERRAAEAAARKAREEAEAKARAAQEMDIEAQREAAEAQKAARSVESVMGLRTVTRYEIADHRALLHWIAKNDRGAVVEFIEEWARRNHRDHVSADGLRVWQEKVAY